MAEEARTEWAASGEEGRVMGSGDVEREDIGLRMRLVRLVICDSCYVSKQPFRYVLVLDDCEFHAFIFFSRIVQSHALHRLSLSAARSPWQPPGPIPIKLPRSPSTHSGLTFTCESK